jgi:hypothetical protein
LLINEQGRQHFPTRNSRRTPPRCRDRSCLHVRAGHARPFRAFDLPYAGGHSPGGGLGTQCIVPGDPHRLVHRDVQYPWLRAADDSDSRNRIRDCGCAAYPERTACDGGRCPDTDKGGTCRFSYCCDRFMVELGPGAGRWRVACTRDRQARESRFRMARGRQLLSVVCLQ